MAALVFVWAIVVGVFSGEKYMMWYFRNLGGGSEYDPKKFKVVHACFLMCGAACFLMCGLLEQGPVPLLFLVILSLLSRNLD